MPARARSSRPRAAASSPSLQAKGGVWLPFPAATKNPLAMALNVRKLALLCRHEGVELVHARSRAPAWVALAAGKALKLPFVTTYHGSYASRSAVKTLYNSVMARGDVVIANSGYTADLILAKHGFARDRIRVVHRGTNFSAFAPAAVGARAHPGPAQGLGRRAASAHRAAAGPADRLERPARPDRGGPHPARRRRQRYRLHPRRRPSGPRRLCQGTRPGSSPRPGSRAVSSASAIAPTCPPPCSRPRSSTVPSTEPEAFGRVAVEAQAMGAPVVVSDLGAVPETVLAPPQTSPGRAHRLARAARAMPPRSPPASPRRWLCGPRRAMRWPAAPASMSSGISRSRPW